MRAWHEEKNAPATGTELCKTDDIQPGEAKEFVYGKSTRDPFHLFVYNDKGTLRCYMNKCPHFSVPLNANPGQFFTSDRSQFMCCFHYAKFNFEDGYCTDGPPEGSSLEKIPLLIRDGMICIGEPQTDEARHVQAHSILEN